MVFDPEKLIRPQLRDLPVYQPGKSPAEIERLYGISGCVKMASNENPLGPSPLALEALSKALRFAHIYPDGDARALKEALAARLHLEPERLVVSSGVDEVFDLMVYAFVEPGDEVVVGYPSFSSYELAALTMGAKIARVPLAGYDQDVRGMLAAVSDRTKLIFLCSPLNPTGTIVSKASLEMLLSELPDSVLLVLDEAYWEYIREPEPLDGTSYVEQNPNLLVCRTFSKIYGLAGLRVGFSVCDPGVAGALNKVRLPFNVNLLAQVAAAAALADDEHVARSRQVNAAGMDFICALLTKLGLEYSPSQANFILFRIDRAGEDRFEQLLRQGVIGREGKALGFPGYVRITVGDEAQNLRLEQALRHIFG